VKVLKRSKKDGLITTLDIVDCVPGMFSIFCYSEIPINEHILKVAGSILNQKHQM